MKNVTVISNHRGYLIELTHRSSDPGSWIVRSWTKFLWFRKRVSSDWFNDEHQALQFANKVKREHELAGLKSVHPASRTQRSF
jgi:hypothetical protein